MYIICGLGNPGKEYEQTRHNMGFLTMDVLAYKLGIDIRRLKFRSLIGEGRIGTEKVILVKPQTYMNNSGEALREIVAYYDIDPQHLIVVYDDIDLPVGDLRLREKGSAGTHNGMRSIIYQLQFDDFPRIRIGTGKSDVIPLVTVRLSLRTCRSELTMLSNNSVTASVMSLVEEVCLWRLAVPCACLGTCRP